VGDRIIKTCAVRDAMLAVPREEFIPERLRPSAYDDSPLPS
jgi:protein-L-isoaspartate O-methyltransferase